MKNSSPRPIASLFLGILFPVSFLGGCASPTPPAAASVSCWSRLELTFTSSAEYGNPIQETALLAVFKSPSGQMHRVDGFWDGGAAWRVRFMPDELGPWTWQTEFSARDNPGLHGRRDLRRARHLGLGRRHQAAHGPSPHRHSPALEKGAGNARRRANGTRRPEQRVSP